MTCSGARRGDTSAFSSFITSSCFQQIKTSKLQFDIQNVLEECEASDFVRQSVELCHTLPSCEVPLTVRPFSSSAIGWWRNAHGSDQLTLVVRVDSGQNAVHGLVRDMPVWLTDITRPTSSRPGVLLHSTLNKLGLYLRSGASTFLQLQSRERIEQNFI